MKKKRKVSKNLGRTQGRNADFLYKEINNKKGPTKKCPFYGGKKYTQFHPWTHNKLNLNFPNPDVPIEEFDFLKKRGEWSLQSYCKICYKAYRDARIRKARSTWKNSDGSLMTDNQIRTWYIKNVNPTMICSVCKKEINPESFLISRSMEKGLHNICIECSAGSSISVREQSWLADGDWSSWSTVAQKLHRKNKVKCAGWSRSVNSGNCLVFDIGKKMHADHIIPLRAGGIHDAKNLQPLCSQCNIKKSDQIDPKIKISIIKKLIGKNYINGVNFNDSVPTIERKLKAEVVNRLAYLIEKGSYLYEIKKKKKEVNGQWDVNRAYRKGIAWFKNVTKK